MQKLSSEGRWGSPEAPSSPWRSPPPPSKKLGLSHLLSPWEGCGGVGVPHNAGPVYQLELCSFRRYVQLLTPKPVNGALFGNKALVDVLKLNEVVLEWGGPGSRDRRC